LKYIFLISFALFFSSCEENIQSYDDLSSDEQAYIRGLSQARCLASSAEHFTAFATTSNDAFYGSGAHVAGITFNHVLKQDSVSYYTHKVTVWKVTATDVYFLIHIDNPTEEYRFLKIPKTTNESMITDLQTKYCDKSPSRDVNFSLTASSKTYKQIKPTTSKKTTHTFTYNFNLLAFFSVYKEGRVSQPLDSNGQNTGTATNYTGTFSTGAVETNIPEFDTYAEYVATNTLTTLCLVNATVIPYSMTCDVTGATTFLSTEL
jgi:hypothetical protein